MTRARGREKPLLHGQSKKGREQRPMSPFKGMPPEDLCDSWLFIAVINTWENINLEEKDLFWLRVSEVPVHGLPAPLLWAWGETRHGRERVAEKRWSSHGSQAAEWGERKGLGTRYIFLGHTPYFLQLDPTSPQSHSIMNLSWGQSSQDLITFPERIKGNRSLNHEP
jgi:hypothetical protein